MTEQKQPRPVTVGDRPIVSLAIVAVLAVGVWFLFFRGDGDSSAPEPLGAESYIEEYGGSLTAIEAILDYTDCEVLGRTFSAAKSNAYAFGLATPRSDEQRGRMAAADDRMDALGCP